LLTAPIIYIQGSGGNLLARSLTLDPATVPYLSVNLLHTALNTTYTVEQRFDMYNNWNHKDWAESEKLFIQYHHPPGDTATYQLTDLKLISTFHPKQFEDGEFYGTWGIDPYWQDIIFIDYEKENVKEITNLAKLKRRDMPDHAQQVYNVELECFKELRKNKTQGLSIHWDHFKTSEQFCKGIDKICQKIGIKFYENYVSKLWSNWDRENEKLLNLKKR